MKTVAVAVVLAVVALMVAGVVSHRGFSLFNANIGGSNTLGTGNVALDLNGGSTSATWSVTKAAPGDWYEAPAVLTNTGSVGIATVSLSVSPTTTNLFSQTATVGSTTEDAVYLYMLYCSGGTWVSSGSGQPYACTPSSTGGTATPSVILGAAPGCASTSNPANLSSCETTSAWMDPSGDSTVSDVAPTNAVPITSSGVPTTNLSLPTTTGASGATDVLTASSGTQPTANVLLVEYVNPNLPNASASANGSATFTFTGVQRAGVLR